MYKFKSKVLLILGILLAGVSFTEIVYEQGTALFLGITLIILWFIIRFVSGEKGIREERTNQKLQAKQERWRYKQEAKQERWKQTQEKKVAKKQAQEYSLTGVQPHKKGLFSRGLGIGRKGIGAGKTGAKLAYEKAQQIKQAKQQQKLAKQQKYEDTKREAERIAQERLQRIQAEKAEIKRRREQEQTIKQERERKTQEIRLQEYRNRYNQLKTENEYLFKKLGKIPPRGTSEGEKRSQNFTEMKRIEKIFRRMKVNL